MVDFKKPFAIYRIQITYTYEVNVIGKDASNSLDFSKCMANVYPDLKLHNTNL